MDFEKNYFYEIPVDLQHYILKLKADAIADDKLKENFKKCIKGNKKFYKYISDKNFGKIFVNGLINRYRANIYDAEGELVNEISRILIIKYVNRFINRCISNEEYEYLVRLMKFKFERQVESFINKEYYLRFTKRSLKRDFDMIRKYLDSEYYSRCWIVFL